MREKQMVESVLSIVRTLVDDFGVSFEEALHSVPGVPEDVKKIVRTHWSADHQALSSQNTGAYYWPRLRSYLAHRHSADDLVRHLEKASHDVVRQCLQSVESPSTCLVIARPQTGRSMLLASLIARAADEGFRLIMVLTSDLRTIEDQLQYRFQEMLLGHSDGRAVGIGRPQPNREWTFLNSQAVLHGRRMPPEALAGTRPLLLLARKNGAIMSALTDWCSQVSGNQRSGLRVLVLDTEPDGLQIPQSFKNDPSDLSSLGSRLNLLLHSFDTLSYVAYTDSLDLTRLLQSGLFREVIPIPPVGPYWGPDEFLSDLEEDNSRSLHVRETSTDDVEALHPGEGLRPRMPRSLRDALEDFILAGATQLHRGVNGPLAMIIHGPAQITSRKAVVEIISDEVESIKDDWRYSTAEKRTLLHTLNRRWVQGFWPSGTTPPFAFDELKATLGQLIDGLIIVDAEHDTYGISHRGARILVSGARDPLGLPLGRVMISYFTDKEAGSRTNKQLSTIFGYRMADQDLIRVYMTKEMRRHFLELLRHRLPE